MYLKRLVCTSLGTYLLATAAFAEWGDGLNREFKTIYVPLNQQSGWRIQDEAKPAAPKPEVQIPAPKNESPAPVPVVAKEVPANNWVLTGVEFETGSDALKSSSEASLNEAAEILKAHPTVRVQIEGYTDNVGDKVFNQKLSEKRAAAVKNFLVSKSVAADRLETKGFGETAPKGDNKTAEGRALNRRIEFKILSR